MLKLPGRGTVTGRLLRTPHAVFGFTVILLIALAAVFADHLIPYDSEAMDFDSLLDGLSLAHPLGTDQLGRDTLSRLILGSRVAMQVSVGAVSLGVAIGVPLGLFAAMRGGWVDDVIMRVMDAVVVFPSLLVAVALAAALGNSLGTVVLAIGIANVPWLARIVRSQALGLRGLDFVAAAVASGTPPLKIMLRHILPNSLAPVIVQTTLGMGYAVLTEAALSFIGVGIQPPTPTWGNMLQAAFPMLEQQPLLSVVPGVAIFVLVLAFNLLGDALRDILDPRLRNVVQ